MCRPEVPEGARRPHAGDGCSPPSPSPEANDERTGCPLRTWAGNAAHVWRRHHHQRWGSARRLGNALHVGLTPEQLVELIIHATWYGGAPAGLNALALCQAVFAERGIAFTPPRVHDTTEDPDRLFERGNQLRMQYLGTPSAARPAPPTAAERACNRLTGEYYWGATWTRPGLDLPSRCLCTMTCLAALGREGPLRSHIHGALHIGFTQDQVIKVFLHMTLYGGIPFARGAMDIANDVFVHG